MFYFFEIPEIKDNEKFTQLTNQNEYPPQKWERVQQGEQFRKEFKTTMSTKQIQKMVEQQDGLVNYQPFMENYLKCNVDMLEFLGYNKNAKLPVFKYATFLSKGKSEYSTANIEKPEAYAAELLMVRYSYAFSFCFDAFKYLQRMKQAIIDNIPSLQSNQVLDYMTEQQKGQAQLKLTSLNQNIDLSLERFKTAYEKIAKVYGVKDDLLFFLVQKQPTLVPELKITTLYCIKLMLEANANEIFMEKLIAGLLVREDNNYKIAQLCRSNVGKLTEVQARFQEIQDEIQTDVFLYLKTAIAYYKIQGQYFLSKHNEYVIKMEKYPEGKNHTQVSGEQLSLGRQIMYITQFINTIKKESDSMHYLEIAQIKSAKWFFAQGQRLQAIHESVQKNLPFLQNADDLLMALPEYDYFKDVNTI